MLLLTALNEANKKLDAVNKDADADADAREAAQQQQSRAEQAFYDASEAIDTEVELFFRHNGAKVLELVNAYAQQCMSAAMGRANAWKEMVVGLADLQQ